MHPLLIMVRARCLAVAAFVAIAFAYGLSGSAYSQGFREVMTDLEGDTLATIWYDEQHELLLAEGVSFFSAVASDRVLARRRALLVAEKALLLATAELRQIRSTGAEGRIAHVRILSEEWFNGSYRIRCLVRMSDIYLATR